MDTRLERVEVLVEGTRKGLARRRRAGQGDLLLEPIDELLVLLARDLGQPGAGLLEGVHVVKRDPADRGAELAAAVRFEALRRDVRVAKKEKNGHHLAHQGVEVVVRVGEGDLAREFGLLGPIGHVAAAAVRRLGTAPVGPIVEVIAEALLDEALGILARAVVGRLQGVPIRGLEPRELVLDGDGLRLLLEGLLLDAGGRAVQHHQELAPLGVRGVQVGVKVLGRAVGEILAGELLHDLVDALEVVDQRTATEEEDVQQRDGILAVRFRNDRQEPRGTLARLALDEALDRARDGRHRVVEVRVLGRSALIDHGEVWSREYRHRDPGCEVGR